MNQSGHFDFSGFSKLHYQQYFQCDTLKFDHHHQFDISKYSRNFHHFVIVLKLKYAQSLCPLICIFCELHSIIVSIIPLSFNLFSSTFFFFLCLSVNSFSLIFYSSCHIISKLTQHFCDTQLTGVFEIFGSFL